METETTAMGTLLTTIGEVFTSAVGPDGTLVGSIAGKPMLLIGVVMGFIGVGVGLFRRMLNV